MLRVDYEALADASSKLSTEGVTFEDAISAMDSVIEGLDEAWEADTCKRYQENWHEYKPKLNEVREFIEELSAQLQKISDNFAQADADMASQM